MKIGIPKGEATRYALEWLRKNKHVDLTFTGRQLSTTCCATGTQGFLMKIGSTISALRAGQLDLAIVPTDRISEFNDWAMHDLQWFQGQTRLSVLVPSTTQGFTFDNARVLTAGKYLTMVNSHLQTTTLTIDGSWDGSLELGCSLGGYDAVVDIVSSGATARAHGLKEWKVLQKLGLYLVGAKERVTNFLDTSEHL